MEIAMTILAVVCVVSAVFALCVYIDGRIKMKVWREAKERAHTAAYGGLYRGMDAKYDLGEFRSVRGKHRYEGE